METNNLQIGTILSKCIPFLNSIGIKTRFRKIETSCFLPGLLIENGGIIIDREALLYPGDILHEAGHIAVVPGPERALLNNQSVLDSKNRETEEMMAIAWSYAACIHLEIDPRIVFHKNGYKGTGENMVNDFDEGNYFGSQSLQWCDMTCGPENAKQGEPVYPVMKKWLRE